LTNYFTLWKPKKLELPVWNTDQPGTAKWVFSNGCSTPAPKCSTA